MRRSSSPPVRHVLRWILVVPVTLAALNFGGGTGEARRVTRQGFVDLGFKRGREVVQRTARWTLSKRTLNLGRGQGGFPDTFGRYTQLRFGRLSRADFKALRSYYGAKGLRWSAGRNYALEDFLPRGVASLNKHRFVVGEVKNAVKADPDMVPEVVSRHVPFSFDCWGTALELARLRAHPRSKKLWTYQLDSMTALSTFAKYFDVVGELPAARSGGGARAPRKVLDKLSSLRSNDVVLLVAPSASMGDYELLHATTYLGAPRLSDGRRPGDGDLFFEKAGTDSSLPLRVTSWEDTIAPNAAVRGLRVVVARARPDLPLPVSPKRYLPARSREDEAMIVKPLRNQTLANIFFTSLSGKPRMSIAGFQAFDHTGRVLPERLHLGHAPKPGTVPLPAHGRRQRFGEGGEGTNGRGWEFLNEVIPR